MNYSNTMKMEESRYQLPYEWSGSGLGKPLLFEVAPDMGKEFPPFRHLGHQAVQVIGLHGLIEPDNVRMSKPPH